jgi:hypothetical protein
MATYLVQKGDYVGKIAQTITGDARRWTELCAANPQLAKDPKAGCVVYAGKTINLPASWGQATSSSVPLLSDGRPAAELVPSTVPSFQPTVVTLDRATSAIVNDTAPSAVTIESGAKKGSSLLKWGILGGSVVVVGGVVAWLVLRGGGEQEQRTNGAVDWLKHKIGLKGEGKPRQNRRRRSRKSAKRSREE